MKGAAQFASKDAPIIPVSEITDVDGSTDTSLMCTPCPAGRYSDVKVFDTGPSGRDQGYTATVDVLCTPCEVGRYDNNGVVSTHDDVTHDDTWYTFARCVLQHGSCSNILTRFTLLSLPPV